MNIDDNIVRIIVAVAAIIGAGSFIAIRYSKKKNSDNKTNINQSNNTVSNGDIVGRDKKGNGK